MQRSRERDRSRSNVHELEDISAFF